MGRVIEIKTQGWPKVPGFLFAVGLFLAPCVSLAGPNTGGMLILHASSTIYTNDEPASY
jgi:hypothetical protein